MYLFFFLATHKPFTLQSTYLQARPFILSIILQRQCRKQWMLLGLLGFIRWVIMVLYCHDSSAMFMKLGRLHYRLSRDKARKICRGSSMLSGPKPPPLLPMPPARVLDNADFVVGMEPSLAPAAERREEEVEEEDVWIPASRGILLSIVRGCCRSSNASAICSSTWSVYCLAILSNRDAEYSVSRRLSTYYIVNNEPCRQTTRIIT